MNNYTNNLNLELLRQNSISPNSSPSPPPPQSSSQPRQSSTPSPTLSSEPKVCKFSIKKKKKLKIFSYYSQ
jgi:hypothetical protein